MSANSSPPASVSKWLQLATNQLARAEILTARLDAQVLLADELDRDKSWLLAHPEQQLTLQQLKGLNEKLAQRVKRTPLAYIRSKQEFFGRDFLVTPDVLIPRPETELLVEQLLALQPQVGDVVADIGTGSGAIAVTAKLEAPGTQVVATDISRDALAIAQQNADTLGAEIIFLQQDLLEKPLPQPARFLLANLPYISHNWSVSTEIKFEPAIALFAPDNGLALIEKLIRQSTTNLLPSGYLLLEADPRQHQAIIEFADQYFLTPVTVQDYIVVFTNSGRPLESR